jgi:HAD superfamily hydrolase (TIGR01509 family)
LLKALLFDLDGTLSETDSIHFLTWAEAMKPHGVALDREVYGERISGHANPAIVADFLPSLSEEERRAVVEAKEKDFNGRAISLEPLPGLIDFVADARDRGLRIALVTNAPRENAAAILRAIALEDAFEAEILSEDVGAGKPDPAPYRAALEYLGVAADEAVAFEDSASGIASALGAGIPTVGIASTQEVEKLEALGVELVVRDFTDPRLAAFLEGRT